MRLHFAAFVLCFLICLSSTIAEEMRLPAIGSIGSGVTLLWEGPKDHRLVALTFDDGPIKGKTGPILDLLQETNVPATFFVLGENVERDPEMLHRMVREGHEIGNHTYTHPDLTKLKSYLIRKFLVNNLLILILRKLLRLFIQEVLTKIQILLLKRDGLGRRSPMFFRVCLESIKNNKC